MDGGRYLLPQAGWDNSSALESYDVIHDSDLRAGAAYGGRGGYMEGGFARERGYPRESYPRSLSYEREMLGVAPVVLGLWPPAKRRNVEDELALLREVQRHGKVGFVDTFRDCGLDKVTRDNRDQDSYDGDDYEYRQRSLRGNCDGGQDVALDFTSRHHGHDSDREKYHRERDRRRSKDRGWDRSRSRDRDHDWSPQTRDHFRDRDCSRSLSYEERSRRSMSHRSGSRGWREESIEDVPRQETPRSERRRDQERRSSHRERTTLAPSATLVVKGLSHKTVEDDLYQAMADWGPLRHVRVIKERNSGVSRGFAFVDFPSLCYCPCPSHPNLFHPILWTHNHSTHAGRREAAQKMMDGVGYDGLVVDGRRLFFEYSSKPTSRVGTPQGGSSGRGGSSKSTIGTGTDWMCTVCGCVNFARRTLCFQCNEARADDAPAADLPVSTAPASGGKRSSEAGPTHVLVVRGLDENVNEESLHYEFSKYAPIKDLRLVRDKFTQVSRGFAFIHFNSVEEAAKALEASNETVLEKNCQLLRVAFAKSIYGPGSSGSGANNNTSHGSLAATAAIEAATFAQQYDNAGWAPKEYNPDQVVSNGYISGATHQNTAIEGRKGGAKGRGNTPPHEAGLSGRGAIDAAGSGPNEAGTSEGTQVPQSCFVWDEGSGYYYDAASGFYYDGHRGLYYDGNTGVWYAYDQGTQQYTEYVDHCTENTIDLRTDLTKPTPHKVGESAFGNVTSKAVISAPAAVSLELVEKKPTLAEAVVAAAVAAQVEAKKEKERMKEKEKENRLAGKGPLMVSKKKISNAMNQWKQRQSEGQAVQGTPTDASFTPAATSIADIVHDRTPIIAVTNSSIAIHQSSLRFKLDNLVKDSFRPSVGHGGGSPYTGIIHTSEGGGRAKPTVSSNLPMNGSLKAMGLGISTANFFSHGGLGRFSGRGAGGGILESGGLNSTSLLSDPVATTPFRTDASALGSYRPMVGTKRRFTETPQTGYRDRAAERRSLHGSSVLGDNTSDIDLQHKGVGVKGRGVDMPFPPGVGAKLGANGSLACPEAQSFEVISTEKALDERNVGNRMLRNMGWQEGLGLGKEGTGIIEPVQARGSGERAGLGSASQRQGDSRFETQPGDTYRIVIQKKALARFHEMN